MKGRAYRTQQDKNIMITTFTVVIGKKVGRNKATNRENEAATSAVDRERDPKDLVSRK